MDTEKVIGYEFYREFYADIENRRVLRGGNPLSPPLTSKEFEVLEFFLRHPNETHRPTSVTPLVAGPYSIRHPIADYIHKINSKLGLEANSLFKNVRNVGYRLEADDVRPRYETDREEAGDLYATSRMHFNEHTFTTLRATVEQSRRALALNPNGSAGPYITLAYACINLCHVGYCAELPTTGMPEARAAAEAALAKNPKSAGAFGVLGLVSLIYEYDWEKAGELLRHAIELDPKESSALLSYAHLLIARGDADEGLKYMERAVRVDPTHKLMRSSWGWLCLFAGDLDQANRLTKEAVSLFPEFPKAHFMRGLVLEELREYDQALKAMQRALQLEEDVPHMMAGLGHLHGKMGNRKLAQSILRNLTALKEQGKTAYLSGYCQALIYAGLNQDQMCLAALERSYDQHCDWLIHLSVEPRWKRIRNEVRFKKLMAKVGFPQASVTATHN